MDHNSILKGSKALREDGRAFSRALSLHGQGAEGKFLVGLLDKIVGMLPNAEEGEDDPRSPGLRIARAQNQLWS